MSNYNYKKLDYISQWFYLGAKYILKSNAKCAFVSTNSISQGEHISLLWQPILNFEIEIAFAYTSFKWTNNAKHNANVICVIIGLSNKSNNPKYIYTNDEKITTSNITPLLSNGSTIIIKKIDHSISGLKPIILGSLPADDNNLSLDEQERITLTEKYPILHKFIKPFIGSQEFIKGLKRYCLWIEDEEVAQVSMYPEIQERFKRVSLMRLQSSKETTRKKAHKPWAFSEKRYNPASSIIVPAVSSGRRKYIPIGFVEANTVIYHSAFAIYDGDVFTYAIVTSYIHNLWSKTTGGKLKNDYRYSAQLCYNTFPFPKVSEAKKKEIEEAAEEVLITREYYPGQTLAELYDPDTMPQDLREAHARLDDIVESCYPGYPFANDEARLECLFRLYERMTAK